MEQKDKIKSLASANRYTMDDLLGIMSILRSPEGCPWDREQTHASIRKCLIEETYEVCEAIDRDDGALLREELGDLLFQVVFHARIAEEQGLFSFADVVNDISAKMVIRHPHVFGDVQVAGTEGVLTNWDAIKMETKHQETPGEVLDSVAKTLPSLMRAEKLAHKVRKYKLEEKSDLLSGLLSGSKADSNADDIAIGIGERLFAIAAECDRAEIDAEEALTAVCDRVVEEGKAVSDRS